MTRPSDSQQQKKKKKKKKNCVIAADHRVKLKESEKRPC